MDDIELEEGPPTVRPPGDERLSLSITSSEDTANASSTGNSSASSPEAKTKSASEKAEVGVSTLSSSCPVPDGDLGSSAAAPGSPVKAAAITVRDARKSYPLGSGVVLDGINMTVPEGTIYGLLGASGCGKTTVLSCIVGRRRLNSGEIKVLGVTPGSPKSGMPGPTIGYMPQELALYGGFTVAETLTFFGKVAGLSKEETRDRTTKLLNFLEVPFENQLVGHLSGGQQRRVSLAATLLAKPPILILDEPTVGVDPVLRQSIWDLLLSMTRDGHTTVLITTHYIEEARQANTIGLMRAGVLLAESHPDTLLTRYSCSTMEDVFLKLSIRQQRGAAGGMTGWGLDELTEREAGARPEEEQQDLRPDVVDDPKLLRCKPVYLKNHNNAWSCLWKNCVYLRRNVWPLMFVLLLPVIQCGLFGLTVGRDPYGLHIAVVNHDSLCSANGDALVSVDVSGFPGYPTNCTTKTLRSLSCRFLELLNKEKLLLDTYDDLGGALEAVRVGRAWGTLYFPANYSRFLAARNIWGKYASDKALNYSEINVWMDMSNQYIGQLVRASLTYSTLEFIQDIQKGCMWNTRFTPVPVQLLEPIYGQLEPSFQDFSLPGMIITTVFFMAMLVTVGAILEEKRDGLMERSLTAGVTIQEILGGQVIVQAVVMVSQVVTVLVILLCVFQLTNNGPLFWVILLCLMQGFCGMCLGFFISCLCDSDTAATYMGLGAFFPLIFLSGMIWPVEGMHFLLRSVSWALPLTYATTALRCILGRGWGIAHQAVYLGFASTVVWIGIFMVITVATIRVRKKIS